MLNEALRLIRVFHDLNQTQLAEKLGISRSHLSEIESAKKTPSMDLLSKYSEVFNIPPSSLLYFSERLEDSSFAEKTRSAVANKIIKILNWLSDSDMESVRDANKKKSA